MDLKESLSRLKVETYQKKIDLQSREIVQMQEALHSNRIAMAQQEQLVVMQTQQANDLRDKATLLQHEREAERANLKLLEAEVRKIKETEESKRRQMESDFKAHVEGLTTQRIKLQEHVKVQKARIQELETRVAEMVVEEGEREEELRILERGLNSLKTRRKGRGKENAVVVKNEDVTDLGTKLLVHIQ
ncbi:hypothetical protein HDV00_012628 [Rhizophlyctis rosea]|nr:hypothetical protein HDV00_012628 [Rhizophlyctis rosea]